MALLGAGAQGAGAARPPCCASPACGFRAVCDIWAEYNQRRAVNILRKYKFEVNGYEDYREMLDKEKDLDAVVIATPDFWHAPHTVDCLRAGKHVYCEKEMSNTLEGARSMVLAARETGKLLQIGHQRRSNPRYGTATRSCSRRRELLGRIVTVNGQWNRAVAPDLGGPERYAIPEARLKQYGYKLDARVPQLALVQGHGRRADRGPGLAPDRHLQLVPRRQPAHVMASGGIDYHDPETHEWYDTVMAIYEYETAKGPVRAYYQTQTTNGSQGYFENFMGDQGTLLISESEANNPGRLYRDPNAPAWDEWIRKGYVSAPKLEESDAGGPSRRCSTCASRSSPDEHRVPVVLRDPYHQPHLENFFEAVRGTATLHCPAEIGYETRGDGAEGQRGDRGEEAGGVPPRGVHRSRWESLGVDFRRRSTAGDRRLKCPLRSRSIGASRAPRSAGTSSTRGWPS